MESGLQPDPIASARLDSSPRHKSRLARRGGESGEEEKEAKKEMATDTETAADRNNAIISALFKRLSLDPVT